MKTDELGPTTNIGRLIIIAGLIMTLVFAIVPIRKYETWSKIGPFIEKVWPTKQK